jgi:Kef-type K+ transport system membrane component KefB
VTSAILSDIFFYLLLLLLSSYLLGYLAQMLGQPKLVGEILAGLGISQLIQHQILATPVAQTLDVQAFLAQTGLVTLMFLAGTEVKSLHLRSNARITSWLLVLGTLLPMILIFFGAEFFIDEISAKAPERTVLLYLGLCVSVTSIPVISRIFQELKILDTPFARLVLGMAVIEDIVLWALLSFCLLWITPESSSGDIFSHVLKTIFFIAAGLTLLPRLITWLYRQRSIRMIHTHSSSWPIIIILAYVSLAHRFHVNEVFAAFLAGFAIATMLNQNQRAGIQGTIDAIETISTKMLVPIFFAMIGFKLKITGSFSTQIFLSFLLGSSLVAIFSNYLALRFARLSHLSALNIAITNNARGAPGIVLATIGHQAGLVNDEFYLTLILTAIVTSQCAALWLKFVLKKKWPLLAEATQS